MGASHMVVSRPFLTSDLVRLRRMLRTRYYPNTTKPRYLYFWPSPEDMDKEFPVARADREYNRRCDFEFSIFNKSPAEVPTLYVLVLVHSSS